MLGSVTEIFILEVAFLKANLAVFSNAKNYRRDPLVPLFVPTVNLRHLGVLTSA
jgi:aspartate-semialdehyde dehydrogenase